MKYLRNILQVIALVVLTTLKLESDRWSWAARINAHPYEVFLNFAIFFLAANLALPLLLALYRRSQKIPPGRVDNVTTGLKNVYYLLIAGGVVMMAFGFLGIDYRTLFTSLSIVAAAIAILSRDFIVEVISGFVISFSREVSINDYVKIGDHKGKVVDINFTKIALLNEDDDLLFLPNHKVFSSEVINYTKREIKKVSVDFELNIQTIHTVEELERDLTEALADYRIHIEENSYNLKIVEIRKDSLQLKFQYILHRVDRELERDIRRKTVRRVVNYAKQNLPAPK